jgi:hypothetical protein
MSAEVLRRAAARMREVAERAAAQPQTDARAEGVWLNSRFYMVIEPTIALAVADWLEVTARDVGTSSLAFHAALAVATAYLGES